MTIPLDTTPTFYDPTDGRVQTFAVCKTMEEYCPKTTPIQWHKGSGEDYLKSEPHLLLLPFHEALKLSQEADAKRYKAGQVEEITEERFDEALNCLPPVNWIRNENSSSFQISENITGILCAYYIQIGERYFTVNEEMLTSHDDLIKLTKEQVKGL
mgnify:CR=1 FL=1